MHFVSTRDKSIRKTLTDAISCGLAQDGGLFVPEYFPQVSLAQFTSKLTYPEFARKLLHVFFAEDELDKHLITICKNAFTFPVPLEMFKHDTFILELFHGPTSSFKDFGARFLSECFNIIACEHKITVMIATSGDTGSAVASAFYKKPNINVVILYPQGKISKAQEQQITCWDENVLALAIDGTFDDCQRIVKTAFQDTWWQQQMHISSANSINIGRLLPQITYYAYCSVQLLQDYQTNPGFIIPTGNLGNATAAYWAKEIGFPIREIALSTNANRVILDYLEQGSYHARKSISTLANAMDVGDPSNFERLQHLFNTYNLFKNNVTAISVSDSEIQETIKEMYRIHKIIVCPHTATACFAQKQLTANPWVIVATADPGKFDTVIEPIIQHKIPMPIQLQELLEKPNYSAKIAASIEEVTKAARDYFSI